MVDCFVPRRLFNSTQTRKVNGASDDDVDFFSGHPTVVNSITDIVKHQRSDPLLQPYDYLEHDISPTTKTAAKGLIREATNMFIDDNGQLYININSKPRLVST